MSLSLLDLGLKGLVALEVGTDLSNGKIDKHTSDLGSVLLTDHLEDEVIDNLTNLLGVLSVLLLDGRKDSHGLSEILAGNTTHAGSAAHRGRGHRTSGGLRHRHTLRSGHLAHLLRHSTLGHASGSRLGHTAGHVLLELHHLLLVHLAHSATLHVLLTLVLVVAVVLLTGMSLVRTSSSLATLVHLAILLVVLSVLRLVSMDDLHEGSEDLGKVGQVGELVPLEATSLLSLVLLPIGLILSLLVLELSELLDLVVVDDELLTLEGVVVKVLLGVGSVSGLLEANEGESVAGLTLIETDVLDLTEGLEESLKLILLVVVGEVLDVQVASLLGVLVPDSLTKLLNFTLSSLKSIAHNKVDLLVTVGDLLVVEALNGLLGALRSVFLVDTLGVVIADKGELANVVRLHDEREDVAMGLEHLSDIIIGEGVRNVLNIDVVHELAEVALVVLGLELDDVHLTEILGVEGLGGRLGVLEADEAVASGRVITVERNLERLDGTNLAEDLMQLLMSDILRDGTDEDVLREELLLVGTEELSIERKSTALLAVDLEVSHLLAGSLELLGVLDVDHGGVEGLGDVILDLRSLGVTEDNAGLILEAFGNLDRGDLVLGEIVQVDVLSVHCESEVFFVYF